MEKEGQQNSAGNKCPLNAHLTQTMYHTCQSVRQSLVPNDSTLWLYTATVSYN